MSALEALSYVEDGSTKMKSLVDSLFEVTVVLTDVNGNKIYTYKYLGNLEQYKVDGELLFLAIISYLLKYYNINVIKNKELNIIKYEYNKK